LEGGNIFNAPEFLRHCEENEIGKFCRMMILLKQLA